MWKQLSAPLKISIWVRIYDEVAHWLKIDPVETRGVLILPLRSHTGTVFGMICLCDADEKKFTRGTSPNYLKMAAKVAETALTPLIN